MEREKLENLKAFVFAEETLGRITEQTAKELIRIIDDILNPF